MLSQTQIATGRSCKLAEINALLRHAMDARQDLFLQVLQDLPKVNARNSLAATLADNASLPFGQFAWEITYERGVFCVCPRKDGQCGL